ncbi:MAG: lectin-like protein [Hominisplanchenecus sp.]
MKDTLDERILQKQGEQKRCKVCGELLEDDARFCEYCGAKVEEDGEEESRRQEESRRREESRRQEEVRKQEEVRRQEESRRQEEVRRQEEARRQEESRRQEEVRRQEELKKQAEMRREAGLKLLFGIGVGLLVCILLMYAFGGNRKNKKSDQEAQDTLLRENETTYRDAEKEGFADGTESVKEETETEIAEADIDAVHNRNCSLTGLLFYTDRMEAPVLVLEEPVSLYVNSISGEAVYYEEVTQISFGSHTFEEEKLKKYNNIKVDVTGSVWAEEDVVYVDVQELSGDLPEVQETEDTEEEIHEYIICKEDCTWLEAFEYCKERGGYLVRINSQKELKHIRELIKEKGYEKIQFYIGMRRDPNQKEYYLVDENNELVGQRMDNGYTEWCENVWLEGEPTYRDEVLKIEETCVSLFRYSKTGKWVFNDVPEDLIGALSTNKGKVGYICEIE